MGDIKPIETYYNGYRFRSRLEARWAVFFDALGVKYEYEPEGYTLSDGQSYLPDFYLRSLNIYVEVKHVDAFEIKHEDETHVSFDNKKYGLFMHDFTEKEHGVWFVFGDPYDALLFEHGGNGSNELFCKSECINKALRMSECVHNGNKEDPSKCTFGSQLASGHLLAISNEYVIWANDQFVPLAAKAIPYILFEDEDNKKLQNELKEVVLNTINACKKPVKLVLNTAKKEVCKWE